MITTPKILGFVAIAFVAGTFIGSPEMRAFAANTVFSSDITDGEVKTADLANNAVTAAKIKDGEVKAAEIATDAVGAAELKGVTKLIFADCALTTQTNVAAGSIRGSNCSVPGYAIGDRVLVTEGGLLYCLEVVYAGAGVANTVALTIRNECSAPQTISGTVGLVVFHT